MSQLVAVKTKDGLLMAADRRVEIRGEDGDKVEKTAKKLFSLGHFAAVATSGAAVGIEMSRNISTTLEVRKHIPYLELVPYTLSFFQAQYDRFIELGSDWFSQNPEAFKLSYILLAGFLPDGTADFSFYASEDHDEAYSQLPTGIALTAPRRLGLESRLMLAAAKGATLDKLNDILIEGLALIEEKAPGVGGPFDIARLEDGEVVIETVEF